MTLDVAPLSNQLGFFALVCYCLTLLPTLLRVVFPHTIQTGIPQWLLLQRRLIGILAFLFTLGHGLLLIKKRNVDFSDITSVGVYFQGICMLVIFTLLAITSNDWSVKKLKKHWKQLHQLTYLAMLLLTWHVLDKMMGHWTRLTPISLVLIGLIDGLFIWRRWIEYRRSAKTPTTPSMFAQQIKSN